MVTSTGKVENQTAKIRNVFMFTITKTRVMSWMIQSVDTMAFTSFATKTFRHMNYNEFIDGKGSRKLSL